jgi:hypothetical protein
MDAADEVEVDLAEVRRLGEQDSDFRRSIVSSEETLTIADAAISELRRLRETTGEQRLKIIASALNLEHCKQIVAKFRERGLHPQPRRLQGQRHCPRQARPPRPRRHRASPHAGRRVRPPVPVGCRRIQHLRHTDAVVQFVGRIMRVIKQGVPGDSLNVGSVVFHAGANTVKAWDDLKDFAEADQEWFKLLTEQVPVGDEAQREVDPTDEMDRSATRKRSPSPNRARQGPGKVVFMQPEASLACAGGRGRGGGPATMIMPVAALDRQGVGSRVRRRAGGA